MEFDINRLRKICDAKSPDNILKSNFKYFKNENYWYQDNNSNVLAVAHFDTVSNNNPTFSLLKDEKNKIIGVKSIQLDDRLGIYIITDILPTLNCNADILITNDEELGKSTAKNFIANKEYNWMFEFDRHGINPVLYTYGASRKWYNAVSAISKIDFGSFSDISELTFLNCCGANFGTGYNLEHSKNCYCLFCDVEICIKKFIEFYRKNKNIYYEYYNYYNYDYIYDDNYDDIYDDILNDNYFKSDEWKNIIK